MGFFPAAVGVKKKAMPVLTSPRCDLCRYCETATTPKQGPVGTGRAKVLLVGELPDTTADLSGKPFSRTVMNETVTPGLMAAGLSLSDVVYVNALACRPDTKHGVRRPWDAVPYCRPTVMAAVAAHKPQVIIPMGDLAVYSVLAPHYDGDVPLFADRWSGYHIPVAALNAWVCPTNSPVYAVNKRQGSAERRGSSVPYLHFKQWFKYALTKIGTTVPKYDPLLGVRLLWDEDEVVSRLESATGVVAFDFETTGLKPDAPGHEIVCCSVCFNGDDTIAFMWTEKVQAAMRTLLQNPRVKKVASNLKYETRWCLAKLKTRVAGWTWDTMQAAHIIDSRSDVSASIKFLAMALCGVRPWDQHVKPYLEAAGSANAVNRVRQIDRRELLTYCAIDSRMEYLVAEIQAAAVGINLETWK